MMEIRWVATENRDPGVISFLLQKVRHKCIQNVDQTHRLKLDVPSVSGSKFASYSTCSTLQKTYHSMYGSAHQSCDDAEERTHSTVHLMGSPLQQVMPEFRRHPGMQRGHMEQAGQHFSMRVAPKGTGLHLRIGPISTMHGICDLKPRK